MPSLPVIVTGASGFVGRHLVPHLGAAGFDVRPAFRRNAPPDGLLLDDQTPEAAMRAALAGMGAVVHLAGRAHRTGEAPGSHAAAFDAINRDWPQRLAAAAAAEGVRHFLFVSTIGVHGQAGHFHQDSPLAPATPYARSKAEAEAALRAGFPGSLVVLRPPLVVGPGAPGNLARLAQLAAGPLPLPFGAVRNRRSLLSIQGLCRAVEAVLRAWQTGNAPGGAYMLADARPVSTGDMIAAIRAGMGRKPGLLPVPPRLLRLGLGLAGQGAQSGQLLGDLTVDSSAFQRDTGWLPEADSLSALRALGASRAG